ncbi:unnamed protein product [Fraxinus pennsylvanica]|uniref:Uncharacterized protein n=1 Tax=Fraxinus pennsylvanica TaxID=56036 RepID=A0AAD2A110_9LAMI|nr:unnamed protein product [Fraxinus pennsylvanica]
MASTGISGIQIKQLKNPKLQTVPIIYAAQSNFLKVIQTVWKVGKDGIEAGSSLVPDSIPRPIARISVTVIAGTLALFVLKSFLSTAFFALAVMGLSYFVFIALNKDEGPKGGGGEGTTSVEDSLEEARRIMDKYNHNKRRLSEESRVVLEGYPHALFDLYYFELVKNRAREHGYGEEESPSSDGAASNNSASRCADHQMHEKEDRQKIFRLPHLLGTTTEVENKVEIGLLRML